MNIDKQQILSLLTGQGKHDQATQAEAELPDQVDTDEHAGLLEKFGVNPSDLLGGSGDGLAGKLGL